MIFAAVAIIIVAFGIYYISSLMTTQSASTPSLKQANFFVSLTDPATVPQGTTALYVTYSALQLSVSHNGSTSVQALPGTGTVNVLKLQNSSIVLATTTIPNGSKVAQIKVNISNAIITINGVNSSVLIGEETLTVNITHNNSVSGQQNGLMDLVPSVTAIETVDKTVYVLTASVRAIITPANVFAGQSTIVQSKGVRQPPNVGAKMNFSANVNLTSLFSSVTPTIRITSTSIVVNGNNTDFSMTVQNTGNTSVELNGIMINGSKKVYFPVPPVSLIFQMPPMIFMMPIMSPPGMPLPTGVTPPPKMVITFPNGTILNTTSFFTAAQPINSTFPLPNMTLSGKFYMLDIEHTAYAVSLNSSGALLNVSGDKVAETTSPPSMPSQSNSTGGNGQPGAVNMTIPAGATIILLPLGTTLYIQFPPGMRAPPIPHSPSPAQTQNMIISRMILPNGSLGFPPMSLNVSKGLAGNMQSPSQGTSTGQANSVATNAIAGGASNLSVNIPVSAIPQGYVLAAGGTVTLTLSGLLTLGPAPQLPPNVAATAQMIQPPFAALVSGAVYTVNLFGKMGAHAETQVTAR